MSNTHVLGRMTPDGRREQIVAVAAEYFARDGIPGASMSAIAKAAGVTRALVYHYFPGKEALLDAVLRRESERLLAATAPDPTLRAGTNLRRALTAYLDYFAASAGGVRELYAAAASANPAAQQLAAQNHVVQVRRIIEASDQEDTPRVRLAVGGWLAFVEFTARQAAENPGPSREQVVRLCIAALEGALGQQFDTDDHEGPVVGTDHIDEGKEYRP